MNGIAALFVGGIVAYLIKGFLGESKLATLISLVIGFIVWHFLAASF